MSPGLAPDGGIAGSHDLPTPGSALVIVAHPDDAEFQCGATLAKWAQLGTTVHHLVLTDGSKGTWDPRADQSALIATRAAEQQTAAKQLGATGEVVFLGAVDGDLSSTSEATAAVCAILRRLKPQFVLAHDPWKRYRLHPDHAAAGDLAVRGIIASRDPFFYPEQLVGTPSKAGSGIHRVEELLLFEPDEVNHFESLDSAAAQAKIDGLIAHESQHETTHFSGLPSSHSHEQLLEAFSTNEITKLSESGARHGVDLAEEFHRIRNQL